MEGSKVFSKNLMKNTASPQRRMKYLMIWKRHWHIWKPHPADRCEGGWSGTGKGVIIAETKEQAQDAVRSMMADKVFGASGDHVVIEEFMTGPEVSVLAFTDGKPWFLWFPQWIIREPWMVIRA